MNILQSGDPAWVYIQTWDQWLPCTIVEVRPSGYIVRVAPFVGQELDGWPWGDFFRVSCRVRSDEEQAGRALVQ